MRLSRSDAAGRAAALGAGGEVLSACGRKPRAVDHAVDHAVGGAPGRLRWAESERPLRSEARACSESSVAVERARRVRIGRPRGAVDAADVHQRLAVLSCWRDAGRSCRARSGAWTWLVGHAQRMDGLCRGARANVALAATVGMACAE